MGAESFSRDFENLGNVKVIPNTTNVVELNVPIKIDRTLEVVGATTLDSTLVVAGAATFSGGVVRGSRTKHVMGRVKVGTTAGWTVGAANNVGSIATVAASQTAATLVAYIDGIDLGDTISGFTVTASINSAGGAVTLDAALHSYTVAAAANAVDATVGSITQISVVAATAATATKTGLSAVAATGVKYFILLTATTAASTTIELNTLELIVTPTSVQ